MIGTNEWRRQGLETEVQNGGSRERRVDKGRRGGTKQRRAGRGRRRGKEE